MKTMKSYIIRAVLCAMIAVPLMSCGHKGQLTTLVAYPEIPIIASGMTLQFTITAYFDDGTTTPWSLVTWTSSNDAVATISNETGYVGVATAVSAGTTTITATDKYHPEIVATATLTVTNTPLVSIAITPVNPVIINGTYGQFYATGTYADGSTMDLTQSVVWSSSNTAVAAIGSTTGYYGYVVVVANGMTTITATESTSNISATTLLRISEVAGFTNPVTGVATAVTSTSATLNGSFTNPSGYTTTAWFEYGTTTTYGSSTAPGEYTTEETFSIAVDISGLTGLTTYHYRLVTQNAEGVSYGADKRLSTL